MLSLLLLLTTDVTVALGTWRGDSRCMVPLPCHHESAVYHFTRGAKPGSVTVDACKIVDGQEASMGTIDCSWDAAAASLACPMPRGGLRFHVTGDKIDGKLVTPEGTTFRPSSSGATAR